MKVLVACEFSGTVRDAFAERGHDAWSCDFLPTEKPGQHLQCDVLEVLSEDWDLMIAHPPCDHLSLSGARWATDHWVKRKNKPARWYDGSEKRRQREEALEFFRLLWNAPIPRICLENPMSVATRVAPKTQTIQPYEFGHGERKTTWLWLRNVPKLVPTNIVSGRETRILSMAPGVNRKRERSRTFQGIAFAMADQWSATPELA